MRLVWLGAKILSAATDVGMRAWVSFTTTVETLVKIQPRFQERPKKPLSSAHQRLKQSQWLKRQMPKLEDILPRLAKRAQVFFPSGLKRC